MNRLRILVASGAFIALTLLKIVFPAIGAQMREDVQDILNYNTDFTKAVSYVSSFFGEESAASSAALVSASPQPVFVPEPRTVTLSQLRSAASENAESLEQEREAWILEQEQLAAKETPEAVSAFLQSQAAYADYKIPEDVSYGEYELPFDYAVPVSGYSSSGFGYRLHPLQNEVRFHYGTDFAAQSGDDIVAFADGTVVFSGLGNGFGYYIIIEHEDGWRSLYAHCSHLYAQTGEKVYAGQKIALVGSTGDSTGPHLHLELTQNGVYVNPEYYVNLS